MRKKERKKKKNINVNIPRGKESTEVRITQNIGKESENSYQKLKRSQQDRHMQTHGNLIKIFWLSFRVPVLM